MGQKQIAALVDIRHHCLYTGVTLTGKTTLARLHARILDDADYDLIVYDPMGTATAGGDWPEHATIYSDPSKFWEALTKARGTPERPIFVFVDEAADIFGHDQKDAHWLPRMVRHENVYLRLISQRPLMLPPNVRTQAGVTYMFRMARDDMVKVAADSGHSREVGDIELDTGDFLVLMSGRAQIDKANVFELVD